VQPSRCVADPDLVKPWIELKQASVLFKPWLALKQASVLSPGMCKARVRPSHSALVAASGIISTGVPVLIATAMQLLLHTSASD
jgi:hypothetical protein